MAKKITVSKAPNLIGRPQVYFNKEGFEAAIWAQGYDIIIERAVRCPCKTQGSDNLSSCKNCGGTGWLFINPVKTKAIITSQNSSVKFAAWSEETVGDANITVRDSDRLGFMDRITVIEGESIHSQTAYPVIYDDTLFAFLDYKPKEILEVFMFVADNEKLALLSYDEYRIDGDKIYLDDKFKDIQDITISLRYVHAPQYHVIETTRDVMVSTTFKVGETKKTSQMPISARIRKSHYIIDKENFANDYLFDNSYELDPCLHKVTVGNFTICAPVVNTTPVKVGVYNVVYDESIGKFKYFNGTYWVQLN